MRRLALIQLILFAITAAVVIPFGINYVIGPQAFGETTAVYAQMDDALGLTVGTAVTYRGVSIGEVSAVRLDLDNGGARVDFTLDPGVRVPVDSVAKVGMGTAAGIQNVDIYPMSDAEPYLQSGDRLAAPQDQQPPQMSELMLQASRLLENVDPQAIQVLGTELGASFDGLGPSLASLIDNGAVLSAQVSEQAPTIAELLGRTTSLVTTMAGERESFPRGMLAARDVTEQLVAAGPTLTAIAGSAPATITTATELFQRYESDFGVLFGDLSTVLPIISDRELALRSGLVDIPFGLGRLAMIVKGERADFSLIATQGQVCNYDAPRRAVGDMAPAEPQLTNYCPPEPNLATRGARNAPRPNGLGLELATSPGTVIGPPVVKDPILLPTGVEALQSWEALLHDVQNGN
ncbi:MlaD family protein [Tomitella biformata]|uniref:MlaD family protein n=1 Tax=Tomitella biformata TaxID=630403 RepID=UPI0004674CE3|nr:MlaD family protein [Tomitella biformata]